MIIRKNLNLTGIWFFAGHHILWLTIWLTMMTVLFFYTEWAIFSIPWLPVGVIGTAVAFYLGFKNNQAYDRLWESRKIWGGIVNSSRKWASIVNAQWGKSDPELARKLIFRYIGWTYVLREQLLVPTQWEHVSSRWNFGSFNRRRRENTGEGAFKEEADAVDMTTYLKGLQPKGKNLFTNQATFILNQQSALLQEQYEAGKLDRIRQYELQTIISECFDHQGRLERIKKFPLPRQYGSFSFIFVCIFIFLLPFGIIGEFAKIGPNLVWFSIPFGGIVSWVYIVMELIGDYSENPFEGLFNDVPMLSICRTIEIDLLHILGEHDVPLPIEPKNGILM